MSDSKEIIKEYPKGDAMTVLWKPKKCIHSELCVKTLPKVYRPKEKPWIRPEEADIQALKRQIDQCPSGARSYRVNGQVDSPETEVGIRARVVKGGPLLVSGPVVLEGSTQSESLVGTTAFCRCGEARTTFGSFR